MLDLQVLIELSELPHDRPMAAVNADYHAYHYDRSRRPYEFEALVGGPDARDESPYAALAALAE